MTDRRDAPAPLPRRVLQTFVAPRELFQGFREDAPWLGPLLISAVVGMLVFLATPREVFVEMMEGATTRRGKPVTITSDPETIAHYGRLLGMFSTLVMEPIMSFVVAGALALLFSVLLRGEGTYRQYLAVTTHASLVTSLGALAAIALATLRGGTLESVTPALLLPSALREGVAYRILSALDLFTLWALVVAGLGVSMVNRRRSWASAAGILVGIYLMLALTVALLPA
jgi:hypothetical protein